MKTWGRKWTSRKIDARGVCKNIWLLLLLSRVSRVRLFATPYTAAHQAPLSLGFSRQEHWSGLPFPSPMHERKRKSEVSQSCPTLCNPIDSSLPGSSVHGIFQTRVLECVAIKVIFFCLPRYFPLFLPTNLYLTLMYLSSLCNKPQWNKV